MAPTYIYIYISYKNWHLPTDWESDFAPLTAGWLLMVRKPFKLMFPSCSFMIFVSGWRPSSSDQGLLLSSPRQYFINLWKYQLKVRYIYTSLETKSFTNMMDYKPYGYHQCILRAPPIPHEVSCLVHVVAWTVVAILNHINKIKKPLLKNLFFSKQEFSFWDHYKLSGFVSFYYHFSCNKCLEQLS